ncbi:MAG: hypothetical protein AAF414_21805 [Pseudomonadota bacterium]
MTVLGLIATSSAAMAQSACESFSVANVMEERVVEFLDQGTEDTSAGDLRIGYMRLVDDAGARVGYQRWNLLVLDPVLADGDGTASFDLNIRCD